MITDNYFVKKPEYYKRDFDHTKNYVDQMSFYVSKMKDIGYQEASVLVKKTLNDKSKVKSVNPIVQFMKREENKDSNVAVTRLKSYLDHIRDDKVIVAPTFTVYLNPEIEESPLQSFTLNNNNKRSVAKKLAAKHKVNNEMDAYRREHFNQAVYKTENNSASGAYSSDGTVLHNPSGHNTLTSITRSQTSLLNSSNEKIISGSRHYRNPDIALNNIIYLSRIADNKRIRDIVDKYNLHIPTVNDVISCIRKSTELYFVYGKSYDHIKSFVNKLTAEERCAVVYTSDLYHLRKHNDELVRKLLSSLSKLVKHNTSELKNLDIIYSTDEQILNFVHIICAGHLKGLGKDYAKLPENVAEMVAATAFNIYEVLEEYKDLLETLFVSEAMPCSSAYMDLVTRQAVTVSDTDSSMAAIDEFVMWYYGDLIFSDESMALAASVMFLSTQTIVNILAQFFTNMGVEKKHIFLPAMKPEYTFPVFLQTPVSKHYGTFKTIQEGVVFKEPELEIKGVHLRNSAFSSSITESSNEMLKRILFSVYNNEKLSINEFIKYVSDLELKIETSILSGSIEYYKKTKIREKSAYKKDETLSPYREHILWKNVFADRYGEVEEPEYVAIKIPITLTTKRKMTDWIANIKDDLIRTNLTEYFRVHQRGSFARFYMSSFVAQTYGVPDIIKEIADIKSIVLDVTVAHRLYLQSIGFFPKSDMTIRELGYVY